MDKRVQKTIGTIIGDFIVKDYSSDTHKYLCKCQKCGEEKYLLKSSFKNQGSIQCKCTRSGVEKGDVYYRLTALERDMSRINEGRVFWLWRCECGNIVSLPLKSVKSGNTKSCGCLNIEKSIKRIKTLNLDLEDLTGQNFTKLKVLRLATEDETRNRPAGPRYWYCLCECGNYHIVSTSDLKSGKVKSCGCLISQGEERISKILLGNNIPFQRQYIFKDLKADRPLRFDFAVFKENGLSYLIEYDGIQHFSEKAQFQKDINSFQKIQSRDSLKNEYCKNNKIPLIRIPYTHLEELSIDDLRLETSAFILERSDE